MKEKKFTITEKIIYLLVQYVIIPALVAGLSFGTWLLVMNFLTWLGC